MVHVCGGEGIYVDVEICLLVRSTHLSRPNKVGLKRPSVHKKFLRFQ